MAYSKVVASLLVALISSLISCVQRNAAVTNLRNQYTRDRQDVLRLLSMNSGHHKVKKERTITEGNSVRDQAHRVGQFYQRRKKWPQNRNYALAHFRFLSGLEQIRKFPDTIGYVWTAENDSNTLGVDAKIFVSAKKYLRKKKFPDTCGDTPKSDSLCAIENQAEKFRHDYVNFISS